MQTVVASFIPWGLLQLKNKFVQKPVKAHDIGI